MNTNIVKVLLVKLNSPSGHCAVVASPVFPDDRQVVFSSLDNYNPGDLIECEIDCKNTCRYVVLMAHKLVHPIVLSLDEYMVDFV